MSNGVNTAQSSQSPQPPEQSAPAQSVTPGMAVRSADAGSNGANVRNLLPKAVLATGKVDVGEDLESLLRTSGKMSPAEALRYLTALVSALDSLHSAGQTHGSLSPDLLLVTKGDDGAPRLRLLKSRQRKPTMQDAAPANALAGRMLLYSSPEQIEGATPSVSGDLYALGLIAYTLLVGEPYWAEEVDRLAFMAFCHAILNGLPEAPSIRARRRKAVRMPQDFDAWFVLVTSRKHPDRFQNIKEAGAALTSVLSNPESRELSRSFQFKFDPSILLAPAENAPPVQNAPPPSAPANDNLRLTALLAIFASLSVALAIVMALQWTNEQEGAHYEPSQRRSSLINPANAAPPLPTNASPGKP